MASQSVCAYGDGWLQEVVGCEKDLRCMAEILMTPTQTSSHYYFPGRMKDRVRGGNGMRERIDKVRVQHRDGVCEVNTDRKKKDEGVKTEEKRKRHQEKKKLMRRGNLHMDVNCT